MVTSGDAPALCAAYRQSPDLKIQPGAAGMALIHLREVGLMGGEVWLPGTLAVPVLLVAGIIMWTRYDRRHAHPEA